MNKNRIYTRLFTAAVLTASIGAAYAQSGSGSSGAQAGQGAPTSSLSSNAMTPRANPNGQQSLPGTVNNYSNTQSGTAGAPANAGPMNPNRNGGTVQLNPPLPNNSPSNH